MALDKLLTVEQIAEQFSVSQSFVYKCVQRQAIPYFKIGSAVRFSEEEIKKWLQDRKQEPKLRNRRKTYV